MRTSWPYLTDDHIRTVLAAGGYRASATPLRGIRSLPPGCAVTLQFGDRITVSESGCPTQTIQCSLQINGEEGKTGNVTRWRIEKCCPWSAGPNGFNLAIESDLILGSNISLVEVAAHGGDAYRHLRVLIADARGALSGLAVDRRQSEITGPVVRIEARQLHDLVAGRSGLIASSRSRVSSRYLRMIHAACDWLADEVLPDLARAVRAVIVQASLPHPSNLQGEAGSIRRFDDICVAESVSLMPAHEPIQ